jgi:uncharacterized membrane protein
VNAGPLRNCRYTEAIAHLNVQLAVFQGGGTDAAIVYHRRMNPDLAQVKSPMSRLNSPTPQLSVFASHLCVFCYNVEFSMNYVFAFAFGIGFASGLRALTPVAVVAWAAHLGWLNLSNSPFAFMGSIITVVILSLLAVFELIQDPLPRTPKRTAPVPLGARILTGGLCGACLCAAGSQALLIGAILGGVGAVIGAFAGYGTRRRLVAALNIKDIIVALLEDLVTIGLAYFFVSR